MKMGIKEYYDDTSNIWAEEWYKNNSMVNFLKNCKKFLNDGARVLDLGCNAGYETMRMKKLGLNSMGLDFSSKCIEIAKQKNKDIKFVCDNMLNDLTYLGKFDGIIAIASIIHINKDNLELCFKRIYDILNDNGYLFMVVRAEEGKLNSSYSVVDNVAYDREVYGYSKEFLEEKMNNKFQFICEFESYDERWKHYCYKKI